MNSQQTSQKLDPEAGLKRCVLTVHTECECQKGLKA